VADARSHNVEKYIAFLQGLDSQILDGYRQVGLVEYGCFHPSSTERSTLGKMPQQGIHAQEIAPAAKTCDNPQADRGQYRFVPKLLTGVDV
jgi:hypothetical protein